MIKNYKIITLCGSTKLKEKFLEEQKNNSGLEKLRNKDGDVVAVFICPDTPFPYLDKYSTHLDPSDF